MKVKIYVTPKEGILDPQGMTVGKALQNLGYKNVDNVRIGRYITLELQDLPADGNGSQDSKKQIEEMCKKLLANPVIEDYRYEVMSDE